jgi:beta-xylosidase
MIIKTNVKRLRDPFVLVEDNAYYMYGTEWLCFKNQSGRLDGEWELLEKPIFRYPKDFLTCSWAPEVHKYNGAYYMFTTYYSAKTQRRGCTIMKADSPEGEFIEITNGHITPSEWDCIDGTLFIDEDNQPWMVFVHEWVCCEDKVGSFAAAKLSADFTHFISEPIELFKANEPKWATSGVTDGCFMHKTKDGSLLMIWSNFEKDGYCVAVAKSDNGKIDGKWIHDENLLFSKKISGEFDGGHAMIFHDHDGKMYLSLHSPNDTSKKPYSEQAIIVPLSEKDGTLVCDI